MNGYRTCYLCGRNENAGLEVHHIFQNAYRKKSEQYGATVLLCAECHRMGFFAAHKNKQTMEHLHKYGQRKVMHEYGLTVEEFIDLFGQNYLDEYETE